MPKPAATPAPPPPPVAAIPAAPDVKPPANAVPVPVTPPSVASVPTPPPAAGRGTWSGFVGVSARAVVQDRLAERSYDPFVAEPAHELAVGRLAVGIGAVYPWGSVSLSAAMDTREFERQREAHRFGSLMVHLDF